MGLFECIRQKAVDLDRANLVDEDWGIAAKAMLEKRPVNFWLALVWLLEKLLFVFDCGITGPLGVVIV